MTDIEHIEWLVQQITECEKDPGWCDTFEVVGFVAYLEWKFAVTVDWDTGKVCPK